MSPALSDLPDVLLREVASFLGPREVCASFGAVSRVTHAASWHPALWRRMARARGWRAAASRTRFMSKLVEVERATGPVRAQVAGHGGRGGAVAMHAPRARRIFRWASVGSGAGRGAGRGARETINEGLLVVARSGPSYGLAVLDQQTGATRAAAVGAAEGVKWSAIGIAESRAVYARVGGRRTELVLTDLAAGTQTLLRPGHASTVTSVRVEPGGRFAASGSYDCTARVWDLEAGCMAGSLETETAVWAVDVRPDGRAAAAGENSGLVTVWSVATGQATRLEGHGHTVMAVRFHPACPERVIVTAGYDHTVRVWDYAGGEPRVLHTLRGHARTVMSLHVSDHLVYSGSRDGTVRVWDPETGELLRTLGGDGEHASDVRSLQLLPGGDLASGDLGGRVVLWRFEGGGKAQAAPPPAPAPAAPAEGCAVM